MRYRIYFELEDGQHIIAREITSSSRLIRICDDHNRVIFGEPWPKRESLPPDPLNTREPPMFRDD